MNSIHVLHVEDDPGFASLSAEILEEESELMRVTTARTVEAGVDAFRTRPIDCIVSDYDLVQETGIELLRQVRAESEDLPFILFTGKGSEEVASDAFSAGATDYIQKESGTDQYILLANRIENYVEKFREHRQHQRQRQAIETASEGIAIVDESGEVVYANDAYAETYGYLRSELTGMPWGRLYPDEHVNHVQERIRPELQETGFWSGQVVGIGKSGEKVVEQQRLAASSSGELICTIRDISAEEERTQQLKQFRRLAESLGDPVHMVDSSGRYTYVNEHYSEMLGYDKEELVGMDAEELLEPESVEIARESARRLHSGETDTDRVTHEVKIRTNDDDVLTVQDTLTALPPNADGERGLTGIVRDVTDTREYTAELERYKKMAATAADMVYHLDSDGRFEFVNPATTELTGYERDELVGSHAELIIDEADIERGRTKLRTLLEDPTQETTSLQWELHRKDGTTRRCESHIKPIIEDGRLQGSVGVVRDISERIRRQREVERQNARLNNFASIVSHDLRNPLSTVQLSLEMALERDSTEELIQRALSGATRMEDIIEDALLYARQGESVDEVEPVRVDEIAQNAWEVVPTGEARLRLTHDGTVEADSKRLQHVFENLFANAVEHGGSGVTVTVGEMDAADGNGSGFYVADDGSGVPDPDSEEIFERGYTTSEDGTGFGLAIVRQIVQAHGWEMTVTESASGGARFGVTDRDVPHIERSASDRPGPRG